MNSGMQKEQSKVMVKAWGKGMFKISHGPAGARFVGVNFQIDPSPRGEKVIHWFSKFAQ